MIVAVVADDASSGKDLARYVSCCVGNMCAHFEENGVCMVFGQGRKNLFVDAVTVWSVVKREHDVSPSCQPVAGAAPQWITDGRDQAVRCDCKCWGFEAASCPDQDTNAQHGKKYDSR